jgi:hypothetical protein
MEVAREETRLEVRDGLSALRVLDLSLQPEPLAVAGPWIIGEQLRPVGEGRVGQPLIGRRRFCIGS